MPERESRVIRTADTDDHDAIADVMYDAIRNGPSAYTPEQRVSWKPKKNPDEKWSQRLAGQLVLVAEKEGSLHGFMSLADAGYIDLAFIRPKSQGTGLFRLLYQEIETHAQKRGFDRLWVHASLNAEPAFRAMGFTVLLEDTVDRNGQALRRFEMEKRLHDIC